MMGNNGIKRDLARSEMCRKAHIFLVAFIIVIAGTPGAGYGDQETQFLQGIQSDVYPRNIYQNAQTLLYSGLLGSIQDDRRNSSLHSNAIDNLSVGQVDAGKFTSVDSLPAGNNREYSKTTYLMVSVNNSRSDDKYFVGYSSNIFGSHNKYIEAVREDDGDYRVSNGPTRKKRSVLHLYNMVLCATGCNPLSYKGYGCYCGFLGSGYVVDGIDRCCKIHDWCYDVAGCPMFLEYFIPYLWKCYNRHPLCALDHGEFGGPGSCAQRLCECDRQLAQCLRRYPCPGSKALCTSSPWRLLQNLFMN